MPASSIFHGKQEKSNISRASITVMDLLGKAEEVFEDDLLIFDEDESEQLCPPSRKGNPQLEETRRKRRAKP